MSRFAFSWAESSYTVGFIWGRPRLRKPRLEPHSPARNRPARRCAAESRDPARVTRLMPSLSCAIPRVAVRKPCVKRFCSGVSRGGGAGVVGADSATARAESGDGSGCCAPREVVAMQNKTARQRIKWSSVVSRWKPWLYCQPDGSRNLAPDPHFRGSCRRARAFLPARGRGASPPRLRRRRRLPPGSGARRDRVDGRGGHPRAGRPDSRGAPRRRRSRRRGRAQGCGPARLHLLRAPHGRPSRRSLRGHPPVRRTRRARLHLRAAGDRKSTRLNSSHDQISYAVFCLKKKKKTINILFFSKKKKTNK